jgi:site-specific DNA-methyltransferase (adenine-specific)
LKVEEWKIEDVKPYGKNPRNNDDAVDATANSIKEFGWQQPIVVDKKGVIIVGHTRLKAAKKLKLHTVPVVVAESLSEEQAKAYRLADNKTGELADWDMGLLDDELNAIDDIDMTDFGFDLGSLDDDKEVVDDEFDPEPPEEPTSQVGDIYQLGRHRLMVGDSTDTDQVTALMGGQQADLLLTDPPYNVAYEGKTKQKMKIQNDHQASDEFYEFLFKAFTAAADNLKAGAAFYIWYASAEVVNFVSAAEAAGLSVREELVWRKNSMVLGRQDYQWQHEPCLYGWMSNGSHAWYSDRKQTTVMNFDRPTASKLHPTMKPVPLFDYQIKNSSKAGDNVLDLFGGSETTMIACEQDDRNAYLMELDPKYADVIIKRWEDFTGKKADKITK